MTRFRSSSSSIVYAKPPHAIYVLKDSGITKPKDLEGKKLADTAFSAVPKMFGAYAKAAGIDASKVTWVVAGSDTLPGMLSTRPRRRHRPVHGGRAAAEESRRAERHCRSSPMRTSVSIYYGSGIIAMESTLQIESRHGSPFRGRHAAWV